MWKRFKKNFISPDQLTFYATVYNLIIFGVVLVLVVFTSPLLPSQIPLFYSLPWGDSQLATTSQFIILPAIALLITLLNLTISWHLHQSQVALKRILCIGSALMSLFVFITAIKIIFIFL